MHRSRDQNILPLESRFISSFNSASLKFDRRVFKHKIEMHLRAACTLCMCNSLSVWISLKRRVYARAPESERFHLKYKTFPRSR